MIRLSFIITLLLIISNDLTSQEQVDDELLQFSGVVVTQGANGEMEPLPYTSIAIKGTSKGTYAEIDGFFSLVARQSDTIVFSRLGFENVEVGIPDTLDSKFYSWYQIMSKDDVLLPESVIYPWPSKDHYKIEFLAMDVSNELRERAKDNIAKEVLEKLQHAVPPDGAEAYSLTQERQFEEFKYSGQYKPQNIFNVASWAQFIKAWKRGDFKKKKNKDKK
ncbi:carboxypeptidase-like regulatory domain-containing protein [Saprospiraceae bacterium]|nr:carboxypeptidase-like regulatory domain-containing protein [Saprospiraceae bacterium]